MDLDRESLVYKAKLAEQAERFDEMVAQMKEVAKQPQELTVEERNLLSVAYKNVIGSRRASWRVVTSIEQKGDQDKMTIIKDYKSKIENELVEICNEILGIIDESLIPNSTSEEAKVFYYKMKGDYHRYLPEFHPEKNNDGSDDTVNISPECASILILAGATGGALMSTLVNPLLASIGFTATGVTSGSFAAWWQSTMPLVSSGSLFASLQSIAMSGVSSNLVIASSVGGVATAKKLTEFCKRIDDLDPQSTKGEVVRKVAQTSKDAMNYISATIDDVDPHSTQGKIIEGAKKISNFEVPSWKDMKAYISKTIGKEISKKEL